MPKLKENRYYAALHKIVFNTQATKDAAVLYFSSIFGSIVGFIGSLLVARTLGPAQFGIVTAYNSIILTAAGLTEFGLSTGLIRYATPLLKENKSSEARQYFKFIFWAEIASGILVLLVGFAISGLIRRWLGGNLPETLVYVAIVAASISSASAYIGAALNAHKMFWRNAMVLIIVNSIKLTSVLLLAFAHLLSLHAVIGLYFGLTIVLAIIGMFVTPKDYLGRNRGADYRTVTRNIFHFSGWLTLTYLLSSVSGRLDFFYLYHIKGPHAAGVYSAALQFSIAFSLLIGTLSTVVTPYVSERVDYKDKIAFLRKAIPLAGLCGLAVMASMFILPYVILLLFGAKYAAAIPPLRILCVHFGLNVFLIPISLMFIPYNKIKVGTMVTTLQLGVALLFYPILIRQFGAVGAALTILINTVLATIIYTVILTNLLRKDANQYHATLNVGSAT